MRHLPIRSETDAFRATAGIVALLAVSVLLGWLTASIAGFVVFVALATAAVVIYMFVPERDRREPLREAAAGPHRRGDGEGRHVIVVANARLGGEALGERIRGPGGQVELEILAPLLLSRAHLAYSDVDRELGEARVRLSRSLAWARTQGFKAHGDVGDPSASTALEDALRDFGADEVIVATRGQESGRQEREELARLRDELDVPVVEMSMR